MIRLRKINISFGDIGTPVFKHVLRDISLDIYEGEYVSVIGSNGAGKSTLLNTIAGEVLVTSGEICIDDEDVTNLSTNKRAKHVARVFQDPLIGTCASLTIAENLALAFKRGKSRNLDLAVTGKIIDKFVDAVKFFNLSLEDRLDTPMAMLSGGQRQAVSLVMSTLSPLKILLLDEHTSALDPKTSKSVMDLTKEIIASNNLTAMMVTHSLSQALAYGTRTIMLHEGKVILDVKGDERKNLTVQDLMRQFGTSIDNDRSLLNF